MFYDNKNGIIINKLPKNSIGPNGQFYINFDSANNISLWADHGYFSVRNDSPAEPSETHEEDVSKRVITIDYPYADITRTWIIQTAPIVHSNISVPPPPENIDTEL